MSAIAALFNVPSNAQELSQWATAHATHHRDINRVLYQLTGADLPEFVLDPIDPSNTGVWEDQHQVMHQNQNAILGINGFDLSEVDFKNLDLLTGWITLNANEHYQAAAILGIG